MVVREIMRADFPTVPPEAPLAEAYRSMEQCGLLSLPVVDAAGSLVGMLAGADLLRAALPVFADGLQHLGFLPKSYRFHGYDQDRLHATTVREIMTSEDLLTTDPEAPVVEVAHEMLQRRIRAVPVLAAGHVVGLVTHTDLVRAVMGLSLLGGGGQ